MRNKYTVTESEKNRILNKHSLLREQSYTPTPIVGGANPVQDLVKTATDWVTTNKDNIPTSVEGITKLLTTMVSNNQIQPNILPYIKNAIETASGGTLKLPDIPVPPIVGGANPAQALIDAATSWVTSNKDKLPKTVEEITTLLNTMVTNKQLKPEVLPYIKNAIEQVMGGSIKFPTIPSVGGGGQPIAFGTVNPKIKTLQELLNKKYNSGLVTDGKLGPKTIDAIQKAIATKLSSSTPGKSPLPTTLPNGMTIPSLVSTPKSSTEVTPKSSTETPNQVGTVNDKEFV